MLISVFLPLTYAQEAVLFFAPSAVIKDYTLQPVGSTFVVKVNITNVNDLYAGGVRVFFNTTLLDVVSIVSGGFIQGPEGTTFNFRVNNPSGWVLASESIVGWNPGVSGSGTLFVITFQVQGYGCSTITFDTGSSTFLWDSALQNIPFTMANGYFKNKLLGDSNGDKVVSVADMGLLSAMWTGVPGALPYKRDADNNDDGVITVGDMGITSANWGRTTP